MRALLALLVFAAPISCKAAESVAALRVVGTVDGAAFECAAFGPGERLLNTAGGALVAMLRCGGGEPVACIVDNPPGVHIGRFPNTLEIGCHTPPATGAFRVSQLPGFQQVSPGQAAAFTIRVANTTGGVLTNLTATSVEAPNCVAQRTSLTTGATWECTCSLTAGANDMTVNVRVTAHTASGTTLTTSANARIFVRGPRLMLKVMPPTQTIAAGASPAWTVFVANLGDGAQTDVYEADNLSDSTCAFGPYTLQEKTGISLACRQPHAVTSYVTLHHAQARSATGVMLSATASASVTVSDRIFAYGFDDGIFKNGYER